MLNQYFDWLVSIGPKLSDAWKGIVVAIAIVTLLGGYLFKSGKKTAAQVATQTPISLDLDDLVSLVQTRLSVGDSSPTQIGKQNPDIQKFRRSLEYVSAHRTLFEPPELSAQTFPKELAVC